MQCGKEFSRELELPSLQPSEGGIQKQLILNQPTYDSWQLQQAKCKHSYFRHIETLLIKKPMENTSENSAVKTYLEKKNESNFLNYENRYKPNNIPHEQKFQTYSAFIFT